MATAHDDQKFGFSLASGAADEAVRRVIACPGTSFAGLHSHIGSQIFDTAGFEVAAHRVVDLAVRIRDEHGVEIAELDLAAGSASPTPPRTTRPRSRNWRRACATSWTGSAGRPG